jgi:hypothetical protein
VSTEYVVEGFIFETDLRDIKQSTIQHDSRHDLPFGDKFYFQQQLKLADLPSDINSTILSKQRKNKISGFGYSQNLVV